MLLRAAPAPGVAADYDIDLHVSHELRISDGVGSSMRRVPQCPATRFQYGGPVRADGDRRRRRDVLVVERGVEQPVPR